MAANRMWMGALLVIGASCRAGQDEAPKNEHSGAAGGEAQSVERWTAVQSQGGASVILPASLRALRSAQVEAASRRVRVTTQAMNAGIAKKAEVAWAMKAARLLVDESNGKFGRQDTVSAELFLDTTRKVEEASGIRDVWFSIRFAKTQTLPWDSAHSYSTVLAHWRLNCTSLAPTIVEFAVEDPGQAGEPEILVLPSSSSTVSSPPPGTAGEAALRNFCAYAQAHQARP